MIGLKFGRWLVVADAPSRKYPTSTVKMFRCRCDCGIERDVKATSLRTGYSQSCHSGNCHNNSLPTGVAAFNKVLDQYKYGARTRGLSWCLSDDEFRGLTSSPCHYCEGLPSHHAAKVHARNTGDYLYNGIDRKDNAIGYVVSNCVSCCRTCNLAKRDSPYEEFIIWLRKISQIWR